MYYAKKRRHIQGNPKHLMPDGKPPVRLETHTQDPR